MEGYNTYIGMRYVPIIIGEWNNETKYEPLSIVLYQGNSYTSKTFVPAGVVPTNTEYWALTGNYNAQIEQYRQETVNAVATANTAKSTAESAEAKADSVTEAVSENTEKINAEITARENADAETLDTVKRTYNKLSGIKIICIGDSYGEGYAPSTGTVASNGWGQQLKSLLGLSGGSYYESMISGAGASSQRNGGGYAQQLASLSASISNKDEIDWIVVMGGVNDIESTASLVKQGFVDLAEEANNYPNAKILLGFIGNNRSDTSDFNKIPGLVKLYMQGAESNGFAYAHNIEFTLSNPSLLDSDGIHAVKQGNADIAKNVFMCMMTGSCNVYHTGYASVTGSGNGTIKFVTHNDTTFLYLSALNASWSSSYPSIAGNNGAIKLGDVGSGLPYMGNSSTTNYLCNVVAVIGYNDPSRKFGVFAGAIYIANGSIYFKTSNVTANGDNYAAISGIYQFSCYSSTAVTQTLAE